MDMYEEILAGLRGKERLVLATIVSSSGSTPVPPGAKMLVRDGGAIPVGTVGGGCVEADVLGEARRFLSSGGASLIRRFTLTEDDIESGMLCGGTIDVFVERLVPEEGRVYAAMLSGRESGRDGAVVTIIGQSNEKQGKVLVSLGASGVDEEGFQALERITTPIPALFEETLRGAVHRQTVVRLPFSGGEYLIEPVIGIQDLIIFGGGHVSKYVSRSAAMAGFRVTVVDDRQEYANPHRFPEAHRTLAVGFDESWGLVEVRASTSIVIVTRGHKFDERILERAVQTEARYIGMIGSTRKVTATFEKLVRRGISRQVLKRVHAPIGLDIGALSAEEIGISIAAELIAVRRGALSFAGVMSARVSEFFQRGAAGPD
jgi:xanthine dehydrogenase accessory factor